jgi:hypothetical protein
VSPLMPLPIDGGHLPLWCVIVEYLHGRGACATAAPELE